MPDDPRAGDPRYHDKPAGRLLGQDVRVRKVSRMVPVSGALTAPLQKEILDALQAYMQSAKLSQSDVAEAIGQSATYINNLLSHSPALPPATRDRMLRDLNNWLEREARATASQVDPDFIRHRVSERIFDLAERLTEREDIAIAYSPGGCGKSTTVQALTAEIPSAIGIEAGHDTRTAPKLLAVIYRAACGRGRNRHMLTLAEVADRLRMPERISTRTLLIIDDAHKLPIKCFDVLMELHNRARCSILLLGTTDLRQRVSSDDDPFYGQLSSRVGIRVNLTPELASHAGDGGSLASGRLSGGKVFTADVVRKLAARRRLKWHPKAIATLVAIANTQRGCLRRVDRLVFWAVKAATQDGAELVTEAHLDIAAQVVEEELRLPSEERGGVEAEAATA